MRILCVTHFFEGHGGGIERVAGQLAHALADRGHGVSWAASSADPAPADARITALPLACIDPAERLTGLPLPLPLPGALAALRRAVADCDVVIVHDALYASSLAAMRLARCQGKPVILIQHIAAIPFASATLRTIMATANALVTRPMLRAADQVIFISETVRQAFAGVPLRRAPRLLFNGVDGAVFHPGPARRARFGLPDHGLPDHGPVAAFVGRFVAKKGLPVLRAVAQARPDITFALAGSGPIDPTGWNLPNVRLLGRLPQADIADLFRAADLLLLPSTGEGYPLVIQEAMACGLPVLCGEESAHADPAAAGWLHGVPITLADPAATARAVLQALDLPRASETQRAAMAAYAGATYRWPVMAEAVERIGATLLGHA